MSHPCQHARTTPTKPAVILAATGETIDYRTLDARSNQGAHLLRAIGLERGDTVAFLFDNHIRFFELAWAAQRAGLYYVCISSRLTASEIDYIVRDSEAKAVIISQGVGDVAHALPALFADLALFMIGAATPGYRDWIAEAGQQPDTPIADESAGVDMLYSSGTTGRPKGVRVPLPADTAVDGPNGLAALAQGLFGFGPDSVYLCPAPLYHAAPLRWSMSVHRLGGTVILMEHFDPEEALALIEKYRVNTSQWVPTHFIRMLKLSEAVRARYDVSSLRSAIHAAAPCPIPIKEAMIDWWGPVIDEYYAGSEGNGLTAIRSPEWLTHKGSVGRSTIGIAHICDDQGNDLPARSEGLVYFEGGNEFAYHNDPARTAETRNRHGWTTLGDIGWLDEEGYLYLTDRKSFMIISGGVNIYPQEIENHLVTHPKVADVAVIGAPCPDMGERVVAVVQPTDMNDAGEALASELIAFCRESLSGVKTPRQIDFLDELPRHPTGKLYKRLLRDRYWGKGDGRIV
ncbi:acyl-CoA synthetase [Sphingomonas sp. LaA6.9]|uniref:acyl-CoA synthetase n=1 Tax=Sphingomonas sp. LaA6.9 TaxID=2919914 RepID=UPI001F4F9498|nr:acyl-CoA synthetase [Sphingomonas sp. LaA6.9]MCJ8158133.1 acyl-CoA synthetase [Sphingomonas sp. LaA6.9]